MRRRRVGFTLMELLIVIVILAILAAAIIPQFTDSTNDAKSATADINVRVMRGQIQLYRLQHNGLVPSATLAELTKGTKADGSDGTDYGSYMQAIPVSPFTNSRKVTAASSNPPAAATGAADAGWLYHLATGNFWLDHSDYIAK